MPVEILGVLLLIRTNTLFLAPFIILAFILTFGRRWRKWLVASFLLLTGTLLVIGPWFFFNRDNSGRSFIEVKVDAVFNQRYDDVDTARDQFRFKRKADPNR